MASEPVSIEEKKFNVGWQINATTLISVLVSLVLGAIAGSGIYWNMKAANDDLRNAQARAAAEFTAYREQAKNEFTDYKIQAEKRLSEQRTEYREQFANQRTDFSSQLANQRAEFKDQFADVRARAETLPDLRARMSEIDRHQQAEEQRYGRIEGGISELRDMVQGLKGQMAGIEQSSNKWLGRPTPPR